MVSTPNVKLLEPQARFKALVKHNFDSRKEFIERGNRCPDCVLVKKFCVCESLKTLSCEVPGYRVAVLMNQREQYRSSNTAKVIERVVGGETYIDGLEDYWARFEALMEEYSGRSFVLFPSENSIEFESLQGYLKASDRKSKDVLIIVVDGTWRQARRLNQKISTHVPRVKITPTTLSKFLCRRQTRVDRVCTAEALSLLLLDMGFSEASKQMDAGISTLVEGFNMQCYGAALRPANMLKNPPQLLVSGSSLPPRHPDALIDDSLNADC